MKTRQPSLLDAPESSTGAQPSATSAEDAASRLKASERLVGLLARYHQQRLAAIHVPAGVIDVKFNANGFAGDPPDQIEYLIERLRRWTLATNYSHYSRCADGITMFSGNFDEYSAAFQVDVATGSEADQLLTALMHDNAGWQATRPKLVKAS